MGGGLVGGVMWELTMSSRAQLLPGPLESLHFKAGISQSGHINSNVEANEY